MAHPITEGSDVPSMNASTSTANNKEKGSTRAHAAKRLQRSLLQELVAHRQLYVQQAPSDWLAEAPSQQQQLGEEEQQQQQQQQQQHDQIAVVLAEWFSSACTVGTRGAIDMEVQHLQEQAVRQTKEQFAAQVSERVCICVCGCLCA